MTNKEYISVLLNDEFGDEVQMVPFNKLPIKYSMAMMDAGPNDQMSQLRGILEAIKFASKDENLVDQILELSAEEVITFATNWVQESDAYLKGKL